MKENYQKPARHYYNYADASVRRSLAFSDERTVKDELEPMSNPEGPGVYILRCLCPADAEALNDLYERYTRLEKEPVDWAWSAYFKDEQFYVGATGNVRKRIEEHLGKYGIGKNAVFTYIFQPESVDRVVEMSSREEAMDRESDIADSIRTDKDVRFVYQS